MTMVMDKLFPTISRRSPVLKMQSRPQYERKMFWFGRLVGVFGPKSRWAKGPKGPLAGPTDPWAMGPKGPKWGLHQGDTPFLVFGTVH